MTDFSEIAAAVRQATSAFAEFQKVSAEQRAALLDRIEQLEAARSAGSKATGAGAKPRPPADAVRVGDEVVPVLRKGADFALHYQQRDEDVEGLTFADFVRGVAKMRTSPAATKALSVGTSSAGGYAVPTVVMPDILSALTAASTVLQAGGGVVDVSQQDAKAYNWAAVDSVPTAAWRAEAGAVAESDPTFREVAGAPKSLSFYFKVSRELLADASNMDAALRQVVAQAFARELDRAALRGSGSGAEPRGILNTTNVGAVGNGANGAAQAGLRWSNLMSALQTIMTYDAGPPSAAIMAPRSAIGYASLADTTNQPLERPEPLRGLPFLVSSQIPTNLTVGTSNDCTEVFVGDFAKVVFVMRERPVIALANELFALNGQVGFVCHARADIAVLYPRAFAVITGLRA